MNESYQEAAIIESKYKGEGTADYYRSMQMMVPAGSGAIPSLKNRQGMPGQKFGGSMRPGEGKGLLMAKGAMKPPHDIPPLDPDTHLRM